MFNKWGKIIFFIFFFYPYTSDGIFLSEEDKAKFTKGIKSLFFNNECELSLDNKDYFNGIEWIYLWQGDCFYNKNEFEKASFYYNKARKYNLPYVNILAEQGYVLSLVNQGDPKGYTEYLKFKKRYPETPYNDMLLLGVANSLIKQKRIKEGLKLLKELYINYPYSSFTDEISSILLSYKELPQDFDSLYLRAELLLKKRWLKEGLKEFMKLKNLTNNLLQKYQVSKSIGETYIRLGNLKEGCKIIEELPKNSRGNWEQFCQYYRREYKPRWRNKEISRKSPLWIIVKGIKTYLKEYLYEKAKELISFIPPEKETNQIKILKAWIYFGTGDYENGIKYFKYLKERYPWEKGGSEYWIGRSYEKNNDTNTAIKIYKEIIAKYPTSYYSLLSILRLKKLGAEFPILKSENKKMGLEDLVLQKIPKEELINFALQYKEIFPNLSSFLTWKELNEYIKDKEPSLYSKTFITTLEELNKVWLDYITSKMNIRTKLGIESIWRGRTPIIYPVKPTIRRKRAKLEKRYLNYLASCALELEDIGLAYRFNRELEERDPYPYVWKELIKEYVQKYNIPEGLILSVIKVESNYRRDVISPDLAIGLMQIIPRTAILIARERGIKEFKIEHLFYPNINIDFGAWYLRKLLEQFNNNLILALAAYNGGAHNVIQWIEMGGTEEVDLFVENIPFEETRRYVKKVLSYWLAYHLYKDLNLPEIEFKLNKTNLPTDLFY